MQTLVLTEEQMQDYESYFGMDRDVLIPFIAQQYGYFLVVADYDDDTDVELEVSVTEE
ncbi:MAG: hypothetical protein HRF40_03750 [Nitrososphaera sp.]|jgi:hypothetical protein